jgi:hypothetical protein
MNLPQELIDLIVDLIVERLDLALDPWRINTTPDVQQTLQSCALVARTFVRRCQIFLFHSLNIGEDGALPPASFFDLFAARPHLASYVRALDFHYSSEVQAHLELILPFITCLTNITHLKINPDGEGREWQTLPVPLRAALASTLALPCMRHLTIWNFWFESEMELQELLSSSLGLKTLVLRRPRFPKSRRTEMLTTAESPRVVLDSLHLHRVSPIQAMVDSFTVVDITKLRSLYIENCPLKPLVQSNVSSIQDLKVVMSFAGAYIHISPSRMRALKTHRVYF